MLGWLLAAGSGATLVAYVLIVLTWRAFDLSYNLVYMVSGGFTACVALFCLLAYPRFEAPNPQVKKMILRRRYWLYYALQFMAGARRQIFIVFAGFMMVERFGFEVHEVTALFMINLVINMVAAPLMGRAVFRFGERRTLIFEYIGSPMAGFTCSAGGWCWRRRFTWSIISCFRWRWRSRPISRRSPIPATSPPPPPWHSPSTILPLSFCRRRWAICGWCRLRRCSARRRGWRGCRWRWR
jgi:MFS family permease